MVKDTRFNPKELPNWKELIPKGYLDLQGEHPSIEFEREFLCKTVSKTLVIKDSNTNMSRMKTLKEHNTDRLKQIEELNKEKLVDLLCDKCESRLKQPDDFVLASSPPKRQLVCSNMECDFRDWMII